MKHRSIALVSWLVFGTSACGTAKDTSNGATPAVSTATVVSATLPASASTTTPGTTPIPATPCDAKAIDALHADLDLANGFNVDRNDKNIEAKIEAQKTALTGTQIFFTGCSFKMQGNDTVTFGAAGTEKDIGCTMKGSDAGVAAFRTAAMAISIEKLRLDVRATIGSTGSRVGDVAPIDCTIFAHE